MFPHKKRFQLLEQCFGTGIGITFDFELVVYFAFNSRYAFKKIPLFSTESMGFKNFYMHMTGKPVFLSIAEDCKIIRIIVDICH